MGGVQFFGGLDLKIFWYWRGGNLKHPLNQGLCFPSFSVGYLFWVGRDQKRDLSTSSEKSVKMFAKLLCIHNVELSLCQRLGVLPVWSPLLSVPQTSPAAEECCACSSYWRYMRKVPPNCSFPVCNCGIPLVTAGLSPMGQTWCGTGDASRCDTLLIQHQFALF